MSEDWGACYFDHYERFLKAPDDVQAMRLEQFEYSIQILRFDHVFPGCKTYCSLGFGRFSAEMHGSHDEVLMAVDDGFEDIPGLLALTLFYLAEYNVPVTVGLSKGGLHDLDRSFAERFNKDAIYFTEPFPLPSEFGQVTCGQHVGRIYLALPISREEHEYVKTNGVGNFEQRMEDRQVDPFALARPSVV